LKYNLLHTIINVRMSSGEIRVFWTDFNNCSILGQKFESFMKTDSLAYELMFRKNFGRTDMQS
jgi:hypothetical protein